MIGTVPFLSDRHARAIAHVAIFSNMLDTYIEKLVYFAINEEEPSKIIVRGLNSNRIVDLLEAQYVAVLPHRKGTLKALFKRIRELRKSRNEIVHWIAEATDKRGQIRFVEYRPHKTQSPRLMTAAQIQALAIKMHRACDDLLKWMQVYNLVHEGASLHKLSRISPRPNWIAFVIRNWPKKKKARRPRRRASPK